MKTGKVYFLKRADGLIKVGYTATLETRLAALTRSHGPLQVIRVINGDRKREHQIHAQFSRSHEFGEWFRDSQEMQSAIANLADGPSIALSKSEAEREWALGEAEFAGRAYDKIKKLLQLRRQRTRSTNDDCLKAIAKDYGIGFHFMVHFMANRPTSVSAFALSKLSAALIQEMTLYRDELLEEARLVEADEPLPEIEGRKRYERGEARRLAARIQAKKQARKLR